MSSIKSMYRTQVCWDYESCSLSMVHSDYNFFFAPSVLPPLYFSRRIASGWISLNSLVWLIFITTNVRQKKSPRLTYIVMQKGTSYQNNMLAFHVWGRGSSRWCERSIILRARVENLHSTRRSIHYCRMSTLEFGDQHYSKIVHYDTQH